MKTEILYKQSPEYIKSLEEDNACWLLEIKRLRETIEEKNEKIRDLSKYQLYCYQHTKFKG